MIFAKFPEFPDKSEDGLLDYGEGKVDIYGWINLNDANEVSHEPADGEIKADKVKWCFRNNREREIIESIGNDIVYFEMVFNATEAAKVISEARNSKKR